MSNRQTKQSPSWFKKAKFNLRRTSYTENPQQFWDIQYPALSTEQPRRPYFTLINVFRSSNHQVLWPTGKASFRSKEVFFVCWLCDWPYDWRTMESGRGNARYCVAELVLDFFEGNSKSDWPRRCTLPLSHSTVARTLFRECVTKNWFFIGQRMVEPIADPKSAWWMFIDDCTTFRNVCKVPRISIQVRSNNCHDPISIMGGSKRWLLASASTSFY